MNTTPTEKENETEAGKITRPRRPEPGVRERVVAEWAASGKTVEEMAAATGWSPFTLYRWRLDAGQGKRSQPKATKPAQAKLLAVPKPAAAGPGPWAAELLIGTGMSVRFSAGCPAAWAGQLVRELRPC